jgi:hypothetical protein
MVSLGATDSRAQHRGGSRTLLENFAKQSQLKVHHTRSLLTPSTGFRTMYFVPQAEQTALRHVGHSQASPPATHDLGS